MWNYDKYYVVCFKFYFGLVLYFVFFGMFKELFWELVILVFFNVIVYGIVGKGKDYYNKSR